MQSAISTIQFSPTYAAEWFTFVDQSAQPKIRVKLTKSNIVGTNWGTQGEEGYWLGIGFGQTQMSGSDIVLC